MEASRLQATMDLRPTHIGALAALCLLTFQRANAQQVAEAVVMYGDQRLVEDEVLSTDEIDAMLDSLCALDPAPQDLIRDLRLFKRIRAMEEMEVVALVDSLFELEEVPYALVNEINLHIASLPSQQEVDDGTPVPWTAFACEPGNELYGAWSTTDPNAYPKVPTLPDEVLLLDMVRDDCGFHMPHRGVLTSRFGWRDGRAHNGIDIDLNVWDTVRSAFPGVVRFAGSYGGFGRLVVVRHFNGLETFYAHLHRIKVKSGDEVEAGQLVGLGGSSGHSTGSHLHFEVRFKGVPIDPARLIDLEGHALWCDRLVLKRGKWSYAAYPGNTVFHTVGPGENAAAIAHKYAMTLDDLCDLNGISPRTRLRSGRQVLVFAEGELVQAR